MSSLPEKVFTAQNEAPTLINNEAPAPFKNEALTLVKKEIKTEALTEAGSSCQACGEPGPVFECPECNSNLCCECYDNCQLAHWGDSDTRREQLAGISK